MQTGTIEVGAGDAGSKLLLFNKTGYDLQLDFGNGSKAIAHAKQGRFWVLDGDTPEITWSVISQQNIVNPAISIVQGELYGPEETIAGTYPVHLDTKTDASNAQQTVNNVTTVIAQNVGNTGQTPITTINGTPGKTTYLTGFTFTSTVAAANQDYHITLSNLPSTSGGLGYFVTATTTQGANLNITFPNPIPSTTQNQNIVGNVLTAISGQANLILYGYQV